MSEDTARDEIAALVAKARYGGPPRLEDTVVARALIDAGRITPEGMAAEKLRLIAMRLGAGDWDADELDAYIDELCAWADVLDSQATESEVLADELGISR